jgi:hypothetical protein
MIAADLAPFSALYVGLWACWAALTGAGFYALEYVALTDRNDATPPLTAVIKRWVPRWLISVVIGGFALWFYDHLTP